jgi:hypothetical protein
LSLSSSFGVSFEEQVDFSFVTAMTKEFVPPVFEAVFSLFYLPAPPSSPLAVTPFLTAAAFLFGDIAASSVRLEQRLTGYCDFLAAASGSTSPIIPEQPVVQFLIALFATILDCAPSCTILLPPTPCLPAACLSFIAAALQPPTSVSSLNSFLFIASFLLPLLIRCLPALSFWNLPLPSAIFQLKESADAPDRPDTSPPPPPSDPAATDLLDAALLPSCLAHPSQFFTFILRLPSQMPSLASLWRFSQIKT